LAAAIPGVLTVKKSFLFKNKRGCPLAVANFALTFLFFFPSDIGIVVILIGAQAANQE
jgi:hypothetical protein